MIKWNNHKEFEGKHAFLGASQYHWLRDTDEMFENRYYSQFSALIGTTMHALAHDCILSRTRLNKHDVHLVKMALYKAFVPEAAYDPELLLDTLIPFVNDAIGFRMSSEIILFYSIYSFGTTDAIKFDEAERILRVHDLKMGLNQAKMDQLYVYCAYFCLEYHIDPKTITFETRIYQNGEIIVDNPPSEVIENIMNITIDRNNKINRYLELEGRTNGR